MKVHLDALCLLAAPVAAGKLNSRDLVHSNRMLDNNDNERYADNSNDVDAEKNPILNPNYPAWDHNLLPQCNETTNQMTSFSVTWGSIMYVDNTILNTDYTLNKDAFDTY